MSLEWTSSYLKGSREEKQEKKKEKVLKNYIRRLRDLLHLGKTTTTKTTAYRCLHLLLNKGACQREKKENNGLRLQLQISWLLFQVAKASQDVMYLLSLSFLRTGLRASSGNL